MSGAPSVPAPKVSRSGDPFPILYPLDNAPRRDGRRYLDQRRCRAYQRERRLALALSELDWMSAGSSRAGDFLPPALAAKPSLNACQFSVVERCRRRVFACGEPPSEFVLQPQEALRELLQNHDFYDSSSCTVVPYDFDKVKILHREFKVHDMDVIGPPQVV